LIYEHWQSFSTILLLISIVTMTIGCAISLPEKKTRKTLCALLAFLLVISIGNTTAIDSANFRDPFNWLHGILLITASWYIGIATIKYVQTKFSYLLFVPCTFSVAIFIYNLMHQDSGLGMFYTWIH